jgi:hypothetical protein
MVVKFVNVQGIKLLYKHHTEENLHVYTRSVTVAEFQKKVHLLNKLLAIYWNVNIFPLLTAVTTEQYKHVHCIRLAQDSDHLWVFVNFLQ